MENARGPCVSERCRPAWATWLSMPVPRSAAISPPSVRMPQDFPASPAIHRLPMTSAWDIVERRLQRRSGRGSGAEAAYRR